jgi:hypothetical protein
MKSATVCRRYRSTLEHLHQTMQNHYVLFQSGFISEKEYLSAIKPLDKAIDTMEMSTLKEFLVLREASLAHFHVPEK